MTSLTPQLQAALVGAVVAVVVLLVRDVAMRIWERRVSRSQAVHEIFRKYSDPLAASAANLLWRLDEIFNGAGRGVFLQAENHATKFAEYKRLSTVYRILALLGWIRAFRRELSFLRTQKDDDIATIKSAISELESALADGAHVEGKRLAGLLQLWDLKSQLDASEQMRIGIIVEHILKSELHGNSALVARDLPEDIQRKLCSQLSRTISDEMKVNPPTPEVVNETVARAIQCLSYRESWIYRDWQAGLGDLVLRKMDSGSRMFDVLGYKEFETISIDGTGEQKRWIDRVNALLDNLDGSGADTYDVRYQQLRKTFRATALLLVALANADKQQELLLGKTLDLARTVRQQLVDNPGVG